MLFYIVFFNFYEKICFFRPLYDNINIDNLKEVVMDTTLNSIIFPILITVIPILYIYYKKGKSTYLKTIIWGILSFVISIILFKGVKLDYNLIITLVTTIISTLFNICFIKEWIEPRKLLKLLLVFSLFFFSSLFQLIPIKVFNLDINNLTSSQDVYLTLFSDSIILIVLFFLYRKEIKEQFISFKKNFYEYTDTAFKYWLIGLIVMVVSNLLITAFSPNSIANNEQQVQQLIGGAPWVSLICVGILAPIIEEVTFRKAFYDAFNKKWLFILVSGLVFGSLHVVLSLESLWDLLYLIPYSSLGIAFGFVMSKTKNVFPSILVHMFHNTCLTILSIVGGSSAMVMMLLW